MLAEIAIATLEFVFLIAGLAAVEAAIVLAYVVINGG